jgi:hypothetical protein
MRRLQKSEKPHRVDVAWVVRTGGTAWSKDLFFTWDKALGEAVVAEHGGEGNGYWLAVAFFCSPDEVETHEFAHLTRLHALDEESHA